MTVFQTIPTETTPKEGAVKFVAFFYGQFVIVYGDLATGVQGVVGPFSSSEQAENYADSHNLGHYEKFIYELEPPEPIRVEN